MKKVHKAQYPPCYHQQRENVDALALNSQLKATAARQNGYFDKSVVPVKDASGLTILDHDEFIKPYTTMEGLAKLRPSFEMMGKMGMDKVALAKYPEVKAIDHVHTPGNSSGIVDGAAAILGVIPTTLESRMKKLGIKIRRTSEIK